MLTIFELCRAVHFGARSEKIDLACFRECWINLAAEHLKRCSGGYFLRLLEHACGDSDNLPRDVWAHGRVLREDLEPNDAADRRDGERDPGPFKVCFRRLSKLALEAISGEADEVRRWFHQLPNEIPLPPDASYDAPDEGKDYSADGDIVLDTNIFVELLNELPKDGHLSRFPCQAGHVARALSRVNRRFKSSFKTFGTSGKLIVPVPVLVESYGVTHAGEPEKYEDARNLMKELKVQGDQWPLWQIFDFQDLSIEVLGAYLTLHEQLSVHAPDRSRWPSFTDAFVLAYGIHNSCPVASGEWIDKEDWDAVKSLFAYLQ